MQHGSTWCCNPAAAAVTHGGLLQDSRGVREWRSGAVTRERNKWDWSSSFGQAPSVSTLIFQQFSITKSPTGSPSSASQVLFRPSLGRGDPRHCWPGDLPPAAFPSPAPWGWCFFWIERERQTSWGLWGCWELWGCCKTWLPLCPPNQPALWPTQNIWRSCVITGSGLTQAGIYPWQIGTVASLCVCERWGCTWRAAQSQGLLQLPKATLALLYPLFQKHPCSQTEQWAKWQAETHHCCCILFFVCTVMHSME